MSLKCHSGIFLYGARTEEKNIVSARIFAAQFSREIYDILAATSLLEEHLVEWIEEFLIWISNSESKCLEKGRPDIRHKFGSQGIVTNTSDDGTLTDKMTSATLFNFLVKLASHPEITVEQRFSVRKIIQDYLNNEINQGRMFSYLSQTIGCHTFASILSSLISHSKVAKEQVKHARSWNFNSTRRIYLKNYDKANDSSCVNSCQIL
jgi:hypothetical protein